MAVREAVANAIKHGNKLDETKKVEVTFSNLPKGLEVTVRDFGEGFAVDEVPDPTNPETIAGRWLAQGAFVYFGSVNEPFLLSFRTPRLVGVRTIE